MSLASSAVLFIFLDVRDIARHRFMFERVFELEVIEAQFNPPHHHHGIVKYDAGNVILSLNQAKHPRFDPAGDDGVTTVFATSRADEVRTRALEMGFVREADDVLRDDDNHAFRILKASSHSPQPRIVALEFLSTRPGECTEFYSRAGLGVAPTTSGRFEASNLTFMVTKANLPTPRGGYLLVFHARPIDQVRESLVQRGIDVSNPKRSEIGTTATFTDPAGRLLCLYEPSTEALSWPSGDKVRAIVGDAA
jgi:hypothetical protein